MPVPTLLLKGSLKGAPQEVPIEAIAAWIRQRMPEFGTAPATIANRVLIVKAETGSGKSTVLPVALLRLGRGKVSAALSRPGPGVICTQPRVLTALALATDVASARSPWNEDIVLGKTVGFQTGPLKAKPTGQSLLYATAGVLAAQLQTWTDAEVRDAYRCIIVDEAHERSLEGDLLLMMLRNFYERCKGYSNLPFLLLASATFETSQYTDYFGITRDNIFEIEGRAYEIETLWAERAARDYPAALAARALALHREGRDDPPEKADILIFVPGAAEATAVAEALTGEKMQTPLAERGPRRGPRRGRRPWHGGAGAADTGADTGTDTGTDAGADTGTDTGADTDTDGADAGAYGGAAEGQDEEEGGRGAARGGTAEEPEEEGHDGPPPEGGAFLVLLLNREVITSQGRDYRLVFERPERLPRVKGAPPKRRIIVSTIVAETGLTIDTLKYVVDCGWNRAREVYPPWGAEGLITRPASKSRVRQRKGRVGRMFEGIFAPAYTEEAYNALDEQQPPEIFVKGPGEIFLRLVKEQQRQKSLEGKFPEFRVEDIMLLDPPPPETLLPVQAAAVQMGFLAPDAALPPPGGRGWGLTPMGQVGAGFSKTPMEGVRILLAGVAEGVALGDLATAIAAFGTKREGYRSDRREKPINGTPAWGAALAEAGFPPYLRNPAGPADPIPPEEAYERMRIAIGDDFIEIVLMFDAYARAIDDARGDAAAVEAWCEARGFAAAKILELAARREDIMDEAATAGLNCHAGDKVGAAGSPPEFLARARRFKKCLHEGLRLRRLARAEGGAYVSQQGLAVKVPPMISEAAAARRQAEARPRWIATDQIRLGPAPKRGADEGPPLLYLPEAGLVCALEGHVAFDPELEQPRAWKAGTPAPAEEAPPPPPPPPAAEPGDTPGKRGARALAAYEAIAAAALGAPAAPAAATY